MDFVIIGLLICYSIDRFQQQQLFWKLNSEYIFWQLHLQFTSNANVSYAQHASLLNATTLPSVPLQSIRLFTFNRLHRKNNFISQTDILSAKYSGR